MVAYPAPARFPGLDHVATLGDLTVIGDDGTVVTAERAWVLCPLTEHRLLAERLSSPALLPVARQVFGAVSHHRAKLSALLPS